MPGGNREDVPEIYVAIGQCIREHREAMGLTQEELANLLDPVPEKSSISAIENARQAVKIHQLLQLAGALGVHPIELLPMVARPDAETLQRDNQRLRGSIIEALRALQKGV